MSMSEIHERLIDLIIAETTVGLNDEERAELSGLKARFPEWRDDESLQLTLAAIELSSLNPEEVLPQHLERRILKDYEDSLQKSEENPSLGRDSHFSLSAFFASRWLGWAVAACLAGILAVNTFTNRPQTAAIPSIAEQRSKLISTSTDAVVVSWSSGQETRFMKLSGDIVWSNSEQRGYMRFKGLPTNDHAKECYQLWIFDSDQSEKTPVDGGVFNVDADGEVIIPIDAKLRVGHPTLFAITVEKPGGVVVSDKEHIAAIAKLGA